MRFCEGACGSKRVSNLKRNGVLVFDRNTRKTAATGRGRRNDQKRICLAMAVQCGTRFQTPIALPNGIIVSRCAARRSYDFSNPSG